MKILFDFPKSILVINLGLSLKNKINFINRRFFFLFLSYQFEKIYTYLKFAVKLSDKNETCQKLNDLGKQKINEIYLEIHDSFTSVTELFKLIFYFLFLFFFFNFENCVSINIFRE